MASHSLSRLFICITVLCSNSLSPVVAQTPNSKEIEAQIRRVENGLFSRVIINGKGDNIFDRMAHFNVKGASIAVIENFKIVWAKGYGFADIGEGRKVDVTTLFLASSMSKPINALGILKLAQAGKISLNTDVNEQLKSWRFTYDSANWNKITPANLLSHTAGLPFYGWGAVKRNEVMYRPLDFLNGDPRTGAPRVKPIAPPGVAFDYSNAGAIVLQQLYTDITNQPYETEIAKNVLKPLGMTTSFFTTPPPASTLKKLATGYTINGDEIENKFMLQSIMATGGLWSTPTEYANYVVEMQLAYKGKSAKVINQQMAKLHLSRTLKDADATLGCFVQDRLNDQYFFHDGHSNGFMSLFIAGVENGKGLVIMTNSDNGELMLELMNSVINVYNWGGWEKPKNVQTIAINKTMAEKYQGLYVADSTFVEITQEKNGMYYFANNQKVKMHFTSTNSFINVEYSSEKTFLMDKFGHVEGFTKRVDTTFYPPAIKISRIESANVKIGEYAKFGGYLLKNKRLDEALQVLSIGHEKMPGDIPTISNLAHCYLFKHEFTKAIGLYKDCINKSSNDPSGIKNTLKQDFELFKKNGFDPKLIEKAMLALEI